MDQQINYRVNIDDANFQAKLTQMRASLDQTMAGGGMAGMGMGGGGGMGYFSRMGGVMGQGPGSSGMGMDFGGVQPISYTPPAIAMTPHFGMYQVNQTLAGQAANALGMSSFNPLGPAQSQQITPNELGALSARGLGNRVADAAGAGILTAVNLGVSTVGGILGGAAAGAISGGNPIAMFAGGVAGAMASGKVISGIEEGVVDNRAIQTDLERASFRFITGGNDVDTNLGRGFSRQAKVRAAENLQMMGASDGRFDTTQMREIQNMGMSMGLFSGQATDVESLDSETRKLKESVKKITETLHTSIREAGETLQNLKSIGVTDDKTRDRLVVGAEAMGRMSGRTGQEMLAAGMTGASIFQGTGIRMSLGAETNMQNLTRVRQMLNQGTLSQEMVAQAGGEEGMAQQMTAGQLSSTQTMFGRASLLANFDSKTGKLRGDFMDRLSKGDAMDIVQDAAKKSPLELMKFQAKQHEIISNMSPAELQMIGIAQRRAKAKTLIDATKQNGESLTDEEGYRVMAQHEGLSESQIASDLGLMKTDMKKVAADEAKTIAAVQRDRDSAVMRDEFSTKKLISNPIQQFALAQSNAIVEMGGRIGDRVDGFLNRARARLGVAAADARGVPISDATRAMADPAAQIQDISSSQVQGTIQKSTATINPREASPAANSQSPTPTSSSDTGGVALDTQKHLQLMSQQLMSNYQQLLSMQKELNSLMQRGK